MPESDFFRIDYLPSRTLIAGVLSSSTVIIVTVVA
jgi:hypothetical protein